MLTRDMTRSQRSAVEKSRFGASAKSRDHLPITLPTLSIYGMRPVTYRQGRLMVDGEVVRERRPA